MTTPIEDRAAWAIHRAAAGSIYSLTKHYFCAEAIGFMAAATPGERLAADLGKPCKRCAGIWDSQNAMGARS
jgi:hypothetical protein